MRCQESVFDQVNPSNRLINYSSSRVFFFCFFHCALIHFLLPLFFCFYLVTIWIPIWKSRYDQSMCVLKHAKSCKRGMITKSSIMLGLGEHDEEIKEAMQDLRAISVDILTLGQYLQASC